ncbi:MAG: PAS domain S-box protein, partial [Anaerolineae bacterium]|nr:PAS domain S-box protein [Anaerolineae bacterium]
MPTLLKLLLLEDDPFDAELNIATLEAEGYQCVWERVQTKKEFKAALETPDYDIVLLDYNLPSFDGMAALRLFAEYKLLIPVILVTGNLETELTIESIKEGATDYVHKDRITRLVPSVKRALAEFELRRLEQEKSQDLALLNRLYEQANRSNHLRELANFIGNELSARFGIFSVSLNFITKDQQHLELLNIPFSPEIIRKLETLAGLAAPNLRLSLESHSVYRDLIENKKAHREVSQDFVQGVLSDFVRHSLLPEKAKKGLIKLVPKIQEFLKIKTVVAIPIISKDEPLGLVGLASRTTITDAQIERLEAIVEQIALILSRKAAEEKITDLQRSHQLLLDSTAEGILGMDMEGKHIFANPAAAQMLGYEVDELLQKTSHQLYHHGGDTIGEIRNCPIYKEEAYIDDSQDKTTIFYRQDGSSFPVSYTNSFIMENGNPIGVVLTFQDISEQVERTREIARLAQVVEQVQVSIGIMDLAGKALYVNPQVEKATGTSRKEFIGKDIKLPPENAQDKEIYKKIWASVRLGKNWQGNLVYQKSDGSEYHEDANVFPIKTDDGEIINYAFVKREITAEVEAQKQIQRQLSRLETLHLIDATILTSLDLPLTIDMILRQALKELEMDAIDLLVFDPAMQTFSCVSRFGFITDALEHTNLRLGEGLAGRAALERERVHVDDLSEFLKGAPLLSKEGFLSYFGVPLIAKGHLKGVLEVFHRKPFKADAEWLSFLDTLADRAAISVENSDLFNNLRQSNDELRFAYEATLEGWAHALELHDMETEGHSRRVVEMVTRLAHVMGIEEEHLTHIRRGALLHDIGKLGVSKDILNKNGSLDTEERKLMEKHTIYAREMLLGILFLQPALEIPYSHHEKWDGSGYPLGLKGAEIPLAARIFAIIDVYDALISDRPY